MILYTLFKIVIYQLTNKSNTYKVRRTLKTHEILKIFENSDLYIFFIKHYLLKSLINHCKILRDS